MSQKFERDENTVTKSVPEKKLKEPTRFKVLLHNDSYTTQEFVVAVLREVFHKSEAEAVRIMLEVHRSGSGVAGIYTHEIAEVKINTVEAAARHNGFPLRLSMEPEEG